MFSDADRERLQIGYKQTMKALSEELADRVYLAGDCEDKIKKPVEKTASEKNVHIIYIPTMRELGYMCEIDVSASCAVILKDQI